MACQRPAPRTRPAFTLIELLVVVAITALLLGLALPAMAGARNQARATVCLARLRSLGQATVMYSADWNDVLPRSSHSAFASGTLGWTFSYLPILGEQEGSEGLTHAQATHYRCPLDRREQGQTYAYNVYFELAPAELEAGSTSGWRRIDQTPRPCRTVLFGELQSSMGGDHAMAHFWRQYGAPPEVEVSRHGKTSGSGYGFLDGRVAAMHLQTTYDAAADVDNWNPATAK